MIKIGITGDGGVSMRVDLYKVAATTPILKRIITQVVKVTNIMAGDLKQKAINPSLHLNRLYEKDTSGTVLCSSVDEIPAIAKRGYW